MHANCFTSPTLASLLPDDFDGDQIYGVPFLNIQGVCPDLWLVALASWGSQCVFFKSNFQPSQTR